MKVRCISEPKFTDESVGVFYIGLCYEATSVDHYPNNTGPMSLSDILVTDEDGDEIAVDCRHFEPVDDEAKEAWDHPDMQLVPREEVEEKEESAPVQADRFIVLSREACLGIGYGECFKLIGITPQVVHFLDNDGNRRMRPRDDYMPVTDEAQRLFKSLDSPLEEDEFWIKCICKTPPADYHGILPEDGKMIFTEGSIFKARSYPDGSFIILGFRNEWYVNTSHFKRL